MSLETNKIKFTTTEISNNGNNLDIVNTTGNIQLTPTIGITATNEVLNMNGKNIIDATSVSNTSNLTIEGVGTGEIDFKVPTTQTTPMMDVKNTGIVNFDTLPLITGTSTGANQMLRYNNFTTSSSYTPTVSGDIPGIGTVTYGSRSGTFYRIGNLVFFRAAVVVNAISGITLTNELRISLPVAINYNSLAMPQAINSQQYIGISPTHTDIVVNIGEDGSTIIGASVDYAKIYYRPNNTAVGMTAFTVGDIAFPFTFRYSGVYYVF